METTDGITALPRSRTQASEGSLDEKDSVRHPYKDVEGTSVSDESSEDAEVLHDARELVSHVISIEDDPNLSPWTLRAFILGLGLSTFGGVLGQFKRLRVYN